MSYDPRDVFVLLSGFFAVCALYVAVGAHMRLDKIERVDFADLKRRVDMLDDQPSSYDHHGNAAYTGRTPD